MIGIKTILDFLIESKKKTIIENLDKKCLANIKLRAESLRRALEKCEQELGERRQGFVGREITPSEPEANVAKRIVGIYVNFTYKSGRFLPKSEKRVREAFSSDISQAMAVKTIVFEPKLDNANAPMRKEDVEPYVKKLGEETLAKFEKNISEVEQLMKLKQCQFVVAFYGVALSEGRIHICMELFQQSLKTLATTAHEEKRFFPKEFRRIFYQVMQALIYIHSRNITHMDVKAENVFVNERFENGNQFYEAKLGDFGLTTDLSKQQHLELRGTQGFIALELYENVTNITPKCDVWSLGCTVVQVFCNVRDPWSQLYDGNSTGGQMEHSALLLFPIYMGFRKIKFPEIGANLVQLERN